MHIADLHTLPRRSDRPFAPSVQYLITASLGPYFCNSVRYRITSFPFFELLKLIDVKV